MGAALKAPHKKNRQWNEPRSPSGHCLAVPFGKQYRWTGGIETNDRLGKGTGLVGLKQDAVSSSTFDSRLQIYKQCSKYAGKEAPLVCGS